MVARKKKKSEVDSANASGTQALTLRRVILKKSFMYFLRESTKKKKDSIKILSTGAVRVCPTLSGGWGMGGEKKKKENFNKMNLSLMCSHLEKIVR